MLGGSRECDRLQPEDEKVLVTHRTSQKKTYKSNIKEEIPGGRIGVSEEVPQLDKRQF